MKKWQSIGLALVGSFVVFYGLVFTIGQFVPSGTQAEAVEPTPAVAVAAVKDRPLIDIINELRASKGVAPLTASPELDKSAQDKANDLASRHYFEHNDPEGNRGIDMIWKYLYPTTRRSENLTRCNNAPGNQGAFDSWMTSPAHYQGMIDPKVTLFGTATAWDDQANCTVFVNHFADV